MSPMDIKAWQHYIGGYWTKARVPDGLGIAGPLWLSEYKGHSRYLVSACGSTMDVAAALLKQNLP